MFCWFYRLSISHSFDLGKPVKGNTKKHLEKCESCRHFFETSSFLENALPNEAKLIKKNFSSETDEQFVQSIDKYNVSQVTVVDKYRPLAIAAGLIFIFLVSTYFIPSNQNGEERDQFNKTFTELSGVMNMDKGIALAGIIHEPIQKEFENIVGDLKSIAQFLYSCININVDSADKIEDSGQVNANQQK